MTMVPLSAFWPIMHIKPKTNSISNKFIISYYNKTLKICIIFISSKVKELPLKYPHLLDGKFVDGGTFGLLLRLFYHLLLGT